MSLDPNIVQEVTGGLERAWEAGRLQGRQEASAEYFGKSARVLTGGLFASSLEAAAQMLREHDPEAADFFHHKAGEFQAWVTPPQVQSHEPADAATGIALLNAASVKFVAPGVRPETVTADTFYVTPASGGPHLAGEVSYDPATTTATFVPANPLAENTEYKVTLAPEIAAMGGMLLGAAYTWTFQTGAA